MVSLLHEGLLMLIRTQPAFIAQLLAEMFGVEVPADAEARLSETALHELVPSEYHADVIVLFGGAVPVFGVIVEAQLQRDDRKRFTWPLYAAAARARHGCPFELIVVTPSPAVAQWAAQPIALGNGAVFTPRIIGPEEIPKLTDPVIAMQNPQLAVLSIVAHANAQKEIALRIAKAALVGISQFPEDQQQIYISIINDAFGDAFDKESHMLKVSLEDPMYWPGIERTYYGKGRLKGESTVLIKILESRKFALDDKQRRRIIRCRDLVRMNTWIDRALAGASLDELFKATPTGRSLGKRWWRLQPGDELRRRR